MNNKRIKVILFDLGGVLLIGELEDFFTKVEKLLGTSKIQFNNNMVSLAEEMDRGLIGIVDYIHNKTGIEITEEKENEIISLWNNTFELNRPLYNFIISISTKFRIGILSNTDRDNCKSHREKYFKVGFEENLTFLSAELGMNKPNKDIFIHAINNCETDVNEILFIDNCKENNDIAESLGMNSYLYEYDDKDANQKLFDFIRNL